MSDDFPSVLRTHAASMNSEGWYTVANALARAADEIEGSRPMTTPTPAQADEKALEEIVRRIREPSPHGRQHFTLTTGEAMDLIRSNRAALRPEVEPVAWQYRSVRWHDGGPGPWFFFTYEPELWSSDARYETRALFASPPAPAVKVRALDYVKPHGSETLTKAETILGDAIVWTHLEANGSWFWKLGSIASGTEANEADAKKMLWATYEARIRSSLLPPEEAHHRDFDDGYQWARDAAAAPAEALPSQTSGAEAFQQRVQPWMMACFGAEISADVVERNHRFLEEALELVQSTGCTASEAHHLVDYVFGRGIGETHQEIGGVMVTLAALCLALGEDMHAAGEKELARIWTKVEKIRAKQAAKPKHSPLPQALAKPASEPVGGGMREALRILDQLDRQNAVNDKYANDLPKAERATSELWLICNSHVKDRARELRTALSSPASSSPAEADLRAFGASEHAAYKWPDDTPEHRASRAAYLDGVHDATLSRPAEAEALPAGVEAGRLGEMIYRALYEHEGGIWAAVDDRYKETVWNAAGRRLAAALSPAPAQAHPRGSGPGPSSGEDDEAAVERAAIRMIRNRAPDGASADRAVAHARQFDTYVWRDAKRDARAALAGARSECPATELGIITPAPGPSSLEAVRTALVRSRDIVVGLIDAEYNVDTWGLWRHLSSIDAALRVPGVCEVCGGDCSAANPSPSYCPQRDDVTPLSDSKAALAGAHSKSDPHPEPVKEG